MRCNIQIPSLYVCLLIIAGGFSGVITVKPGDSCTRRPANSTESLNGICINIRDCADVKEGISQKLVRPPTPCYISPTARDVYVCCFQKRTAIIEEPIVPSTISARKCREFAKYLVEEHDKSIPRDGQSFEALPERNLCVPKSPEDSLVGGSIAIPGEFPHIARLGYGESPDKLQFDCTGTLISEQYVLTAAHCVAGERQPSYVLLGGRNHREESNHTQGQLIPIYSDRWLIPYPQYQFAYLYHDIALVRLGLKPRLGPMVRPACLHIGDLHPGFSLIVSGWGSGEFGEESSEELLHKDILEENRFETCKKAYNRVGAKLPDGIENDKLICAGSLEDERASCWSDSGSPLQVFRSESCVYDIIGVSSFSRGCGIRRSPGVYIRVQYYLNWITQIVWPDEWYQPK